MDRTRLIVAAGLAAALAWVPGCDSRSDEQAHVPPAGTPAVVAPPTTLPSVADTSTRPTDLPAVSYLWFREVPDPRSSEGSPAPSKPDAADSTDKASDADPSACGEATARAQHEAAQHEAALPEAAGLARRFPRAFLRTLGKGEDRVVARLYSDDPKDALKKEWHGDRYYFHMPLQASDSAQLDDRPFRFTAPFEGGEETSDGIFLDGDRYHLEPIDLQVNFQTQGDQVKVMLGGLFKQTDTADPQAPAVWYHVQGILQAVVK